VTITGLRISGSNKQNQKNNKTSENLVDINTVSISTYFYAFNMKFITYFHFCFYKIIIFKPDRSQTWLWEIFTHQQRSEFFSRTYFCGIAHVARTHVTGNSFNQNKSLLNTNTVTGETNKKQSDRKEAINIDKNQQVITKNRLELTAFWTSPRVYRLGGLWETRAATGLVMIAQ